MEPVLRFDLPQSSDYTPRIGRRAIYQIITGVAAIHSHGIIHGGASPLHKDILYLTSVADFHPGNFGFAAPELNKFADIDLWDRMRIRTSFLQYPPRALGIRSRSQPTYPAVLTWESFFFGMCLSLYSVRYRCVSLIWVSVRYPFPTLLH